MREREQEKGGGWRRGRKGKMKGSRQREGGDRKGGALDIFMLKAVTLTYMLKYILELLLTSLHS